MERGGIGRLTDWAAGRVWTLVAGAWLVACAVLIWHRWGAIRWFALGDTDDNLRMSQVRAWLGGQGWYDLRQYELGGAAGFDVHWSRVVDLPLAGLVLLGRLFMPGPDAERFAIAVAPLLPLAVTMVGVALAARRLLEPRAALLAVPLFFCAVPAVFMFHPTRIDHHGWQLAMLALVAAGLLDPKRRRGGATVGLASALSLAIGLEMLIYLALAGAAIVLRWVWDGEERPRLAAYGGTLAAGTAAGFALFASEANRFAVCDALSPVWLSAMLAGGAAALALAVGAPPTRGARFGAAALAGAMLAAMFWLAWPGCTDGRLEQVSPELDRLWLSRVREAKPITEQSRDVMVGMLSLPIAGLLGGALLLWTRRRDGAAIGAAAGPLAMAIAALGLLFWQTRTGPAAGLLAVPGATALLWLGLPPVRRMANVPLRILATLALALVGTGTLATVALKLKPEEALKPGGKAVDLANRRCPTLPALRPVALQPPGTVLTFVDLGPRLITATRHRALAGPYHRNGREIVDVMRAWRGTEANARATAARYRVDYVLICPGFSESTIYTSEAQGGFYDQLRQGRVPGWLSPVTLPADSPYWMWRVAPSATGRSSG